MAPPLLLLVGLPGSGKTTLARRWEAEHHARCLTPDGWMEPLFGADESRSRRWALEGGLLRSVAARVLTLGVGVVLDCGLWTRQERGPSRARGEALGAGAQLHFLGVLPEELWRLEARNRGLPPATFPITRAELREWLRWFQRPEADEQEPRA